MAVDCQKAAANQAAKQACLDAFKKATKAYNEKSKKIIKAYNAKIKKTIKAYNAKSKKEAKAYKAKSKKEAKAYKADISRLQKAAAEHVHRVRVFHVKKVAAAKQAYLDALKTREKKLPGIKKEIAVLSSVIDRLLCISSRILK